MATLSFRLPAIRIDQRPPRGALAHRAGPVRQMNAEDAARIALRHLGEPGVSVPSASQHAAIAADDAVSTGWFDSTWELSKGLDICEGAPSDLPLDGWLQLYLAA